MSDPIRVLHVDDEPEFLELTEEFLSHQDAGLEVDGYSSADAALDSLAETAYDCVVSDYDMPGASGLEFLREVREREGPIPFIVFTGKGSEEVAAEAISAGATDYIQKKPGSDQYQVLAHRIEQAVERRRATAAAEVATERLEDVYERVTDAVLGMNSDFRYTYVNSEAERLLDREADELIGQTAWEVFPELDETEFGPALRTAMAEQEPQRVEEYWPPQDVWYEVRVFPAEDGISVYFRDITDRKERERERQIFSQAIDGLGVGVVLNDAEGRFSYINTHYADLLGYEPDDLIGEPIWTVNPEFDGAQFDAYWHSFSDGETRITESRHERADGSTIPVETVVTQVRIDGEPYHVGTVRPLPEGGVSRAETDPREIERELEQYRTLVHTVGDPMYALDEEGYTTMVNDAMVEAIDIPRDEIVGTHVSGFLTPEDFETGTELLQELLEDPERDFARYEMSLDVEGETRTFENSIAVITDEDGSFAGSVGSLRDVTAHNELLAELRAEHDRLSALFENIPDPAAHIHFEGGDPIVDGVNSAFERVFGFDAGTIVGENLDDYIVPEDDPDLASSRDGESPGELNEKLQIGESLHVELTRKTADGEREFLLHVVPYDPGEENLWGFAIYTDISEQKERERKIRALHEQTRGLLGAEDEEAVAEIVVEAAHSILGFEATVVRLLDETGAVLEPVATSEETIDLLGPRPTYLIGEGAPGEVFERGEMLVYDDIRERDDDVDRDPIRSAIYLPIGEYGVVTIASASVGGFDRTDRTVAEILVANAEEVLRRIDRERALQEREAALRRQNERLEEFAGVVSHDLRNPLNVITGHLDLARETGDAQHFDEVETAAERMRTLLEDLLTLARQGQTVSAAEPVDLERVVVDAWGGVSQAAANLDIEGELGTIEADVSRLQELFENLFRNAVEHGGEDVTVTVRKTGSGFVVADDGAGIDEGNRDAVFEHGFTTTQEGTGLGLAIVKSIAEAHGWSVSVAESEDGGSAFEFSGVTWR